MTYDTLPLTLFFRLMQRPEGVAHRVIGKRNWQRIKDRWEASHDDDKGEAYLEAKRKVVCETIQYNKTRILIEWMKKTKLDTKEIFEMCRFPWSEDKAQRVKTLNKELNKANERLKMFKAQFEKLQEDPEEDPEEFTIGKLKESIASLEMYGFTVPDYDKLTLGRYDAITAVISKKIEKERLKNLNG